jgi:hypothetical protein
MAQTSGQVIHRAPRELEMDSTRFDRIATALTDATSRRETLRLLGASLVGAGGLAVLGASESEARKKRKHKKKKNKDKCKGRCGGSCPRCAPGTTCTTRDECSTAFCPAGVCAQPDDAAQCGLDTNGDTCFRRLSDKGFQFCSRQQCDLKPTGTCSECAAGTNCVVLQGGGVECCDPCGSPL